MDLLLIRIEQRDDMSTVIMKSFLPKRDSQTLRDDSISVSIGIILIIYII